MARPTLKVIQGDWQASSKWLNFPATVSARSVFDRTRSCYYRIGKEDAVKEARAHKRQAVFNLWSAILGEPPRVPLVKQHNARPYDGLSQLAQAHACFRGMKRPCDDDDSGGNIVAYILRPTHSYAYRPHPACIAERIAVPDDLVFAAYVKLDLPCAERGHTLKGVLTHWQFVESDPSDRMLPIDHESRYDVRLW